MHPQTALITTLLSAALLSQSALGASLTVVVENVKKAKGRLQVAVNDRAGYAEEGKSKPIAFGAADAASPTTTIVIGDVPAGTYAIRVRHDVNGNDKLDRNFLGIPKEPWGVSNNPGGIGLPDFEEAAFEVSSDATLHIKLK